MPTVRPPKLSKRKLPLPLRPLRNSVNPPLNPSGPTQLLHLVEQEVKRPPPLTESSLLKLDRPLDPSSREVGKDRLINKRED
jgi:hypothetical protein